MTALVLQQFPLFVPADPRPLALRAVRWVLQARFAKQWAVLDLAEELVIERLQRMAPADLEVVLDELVGSRELADARIALANLERSRILQALVAWPQPSPWSKLGPLASRHVALGLVYAEHAARAIAHHPELARSLLDDLERQRDVDPTRIAYDPSVPAAIAMAVLEAVRMTVCLLALGRCTSERGVLSPWLVVDLAERFARGCKASLQLTAVLLPGVEISEEVLPREHRLDVEQLEQQMREANAALHLLPVADCLPDDE